MSIIPMMPNPLKYSTMRDQNEQVKPLAHSMIREEDEAISMEMKLQHKNNRKCLIWCGLVSATILIIAVTSLILAFTVFRIKDPILKMNSVMIQGFDLGQINANLGRGTNFTILADVSVKNPNVVSLRFNNVTTSLYYDGVLIGEAVTPPGLAKARRTFFMNVTMVVLVDRILTVPRLHNDLSIGTLPISSYTEITGKIKIVLKKHVVVKMNCTITVDLNSGSLRDQNCNKRISI